MKTAGKKSTSSMETCEEILKESDTVIEIPARKSGRMNVLGFMNRKNDLHPFIFEQSVHTEVVMACFEEFSKTLKKKTVVAMDNASVHTSEEFEECLL